MIAPSLGVESAASLGITHALSSTQNTRTPVTSVWVGNRLAKIHTHLCQGPYTGMPQARGSLVADLIRRLVSTREQTPATTPVRLVNSERALNVVSAQSTAAPLWFLANAEAGHLFVSPSPLSPGIGPNEAPRLADVAQLVPRSISQASLRLPLQFDTPEQTAPTLLKQSTAISA
jgi:hypothetical protein